MLYCCISRIFRLIAALHCTLLYITYPKFSVMLKIEEKTNRKSSLFGRGRQALNSSGSPDSERGCQSIPFLFSVLCLESVSLFICCKVLCGPLKISSILSTVISLSILSCLPVGAGTIWCWAYRTSADRLQYHVKRSFSSDGSLYFLIWSSCAIFTRLSIRFLTLNSDLQETRQGYWGETTTATIQIFVGDRTKRVKDINSQYPDLYMKKRKILPPPLSLSIFHSLRQHICLQKECEVFFPVLCPIY